MRPFFKNRKYIFLSIYSNSYSILRVNFFHRNIKRFPGKRCIIFLRSLHYYNPYLHHAVWVGLRAVCTLKDSPWTHIVFVLRKMSSLNFFVTVLVGTRYLLKKASWFLTLPEKLKMIKPIISMSWLLHVETWAMSVALLFQQTKTMTYTDKVVY